MTRRKQDRATHEAGQASGATNAIRELGEVIGVAVLASMFSAHGSYTPPQAHTTGLTAPIPIGAVVSASVRFLPSWSRQPRRPPRRTRPPG